MGRTESRDWCAAHSIAGGSDSQSAMETTKLNTTVRMGGSPWHSKYTSMDHFDYPVKLHCAEFPSRLHTSYYSSSKQKDRKEHFPSSWMLTSLPPCKTNKKALTWPEVGRWNQKDLESSCPLNSNPLAVFLLPKDLHSLKTILCLKIILPCTNKTEPHKGRESIGCKGVRH